MVFPSWLQRFSQKLPLHVVLFIPLSMGIVTIVGFSAALSWGQGRKAILSDLHQQQTEVLGEFSRALDEEVFAVKVGNQAIADWLEFSGGKGVAPDNLTGYLVQKFRSLPELEAIALNRGQTPGIWLGRWQNHLWQLQPQGDQIQLQSLEKSSPSAPQTLDPAQLGYGFDGETPGDRWQLRPGTTGQGTLQLRLREHYIAATGPHQVTTIARFQPSELGEIMAAIPQGDRPLLTLLTAQGEILFASDISQAQGLQHRFSQGLRGDRRHGDFPHLDTDDQGQRYFLQFQPWSPDPQLDFYLAIATPRQTLQGSQGQLIFLTSLISGLSLTLGGAASLWFSRWLITPITALNDQAHLLSAQEWSQDLTPPPPAPDLPPMAFFRETYHLSLAFNRMRQKLQQAFQKLESRVEERTQALRSVNDQLREEITQKENMQAAMALSELKFRNIFENSQVGIFRTRLEDGLVLDANGYWAEILGFSGVDAVVKVLKGSDFYWEPETRRQLLALIEKKGEVRNFETRFRKGDGSATWVLLSARLNHHEQCLEGVITDISDRKLAEAALTQSEAMYRDLVETANCIILRLSLEGKITFINDYGEKFFGYREAEILDRSALGVILDNTHQNRRRFRLFLRGLQGHFSRFTKFEWEHIRRNHEPAWITWSNRPVFNPASQRQEILAVGTDITAQKLAEQGLQEKETYLRMIIDNIPQQVFWKNRDLVFLGCNQNWARAAFLPSPQEAVGKTDYDLLPSKEAADFFRQQDLAVIESGQPILHAIATKQRLSASGDPIWLDVSKIPMQDDQGKVIGLLGVLEDITQRKLAEEALKAEREKSEALLLNILPKEIADRLKEQQSAIAENFESVSILFADIVEFTPISARLAPTTLVNFLNDIFSHFDQLAEDHGLEKIKTIGDAYMVVGGLPLPRPDHPQAIARMALDMQRTIATFQHHPLLNHSPLKIRIGINTGPVVAGVIGTKKFIYDLWGDAVNVASRMESSGEADKIQVSQPTYDLLKSEFRFQERGITEIKGKGAMKTHWLLGPKGGDSGTL